MNTATHTPTPWIDETADNMLSSTDGRHYIWRDTAPQVADVCIAIVNMREDAELIIKACNAYDDLIAALKEARNQMITNRECAGRKQSNERVNMTSAALLQIERALAKAGAA